MTNIQDLSSGRWVREMIQRLQHKYALSRQGAEDMVKACISVAISNFCLMMPSGILYLLISDLLGGGLKKDRVWIYAA